MKLSLIKKSLLAVLFASSALAFADTAKIISVTGKVEVSRKDAWIPLAKDSVINEGEIISTGFKSEALIKYKDSVMKLGPLTRVTLEKLASSDVKDDVSVYLSTGTVRSTVNHSENKRVSYTVRNPIAVASVRGTDFDFDGTAAITCYKGGIFVTSADMVDPVRDLGVTNPADGKGSENKEGTTLPPADGTTNSFTSGSDINPNITGGVVLTAGQQTGFNTETGTMSNRVVNQTQENLNNVGNIGKTAGEQGFFQMGQTNDNQNITLSDSQSKGKLIVNIKFE